MVRVPRRYKGADYVVTANEGDGREWPGLRDDAARVKEIAAKLDPAAFPDAATLVQDANLGRLRVLARRFATAAASVKHATCGSCMQGHSVVRTQAGLSGCCRPSFAVLTVHTIKQLLWCGCACAHSNTHGWPCVARRLKSLPKWVGRVPAGL